MTDQVKETEDLYQAACEVHLAVTKFRALCNDAYTAQPIETHFWRMVMEYLKSDMKYWDTQRRKARRDAKRT